MPDFLQLATTYQDAVLTRMAPFWLKHSCDTQCGGYFDVVTGAGQVIDADKSVVRQAEQVWAFAALYTDWPADRAPTSWLDHAHHGATFLAQFAHDDRLNAYARLDRRGRPLAPATDLLPGCALVRAYAQLHRATANDEWAMLAKQTLTNVVSRREAQRRQADVVGSFWQWQHLSEPLALLRALLSARHLLDEGTWQETLESVLTEIMAEFLDRRQELLREYVLPGGAFSNTPCGRRLSPGLVFDVADSLLNVAAQTRNRKLALQATNWTVQLAEWAWDKTAGGLVQWVDSKRQPLSFAGWEQRLAPVHAQALTTLAKGCFYTSHPDCLPWLKRIHDYVVAHFADPAAGVWHLALNADGRPLPLPKTTTELGGVVVMKALADASHALAHCARLQPTGRSVRADQRPGAAT